MLHQTYYMSNQLVYRERQHVVLYSNMECSPFEYGKHFAQRIAIDKPFSGRQACKGGTRAKVVLRKKNKSIVPFLRGRGAKRRVGFHKGNVAQRRND